MLRGALTEYGLDVIYEEIVEVTVAD